jgi:hypothetical protein
MVSTLLYIVALRLALDVVSEVVGSGLRRGVELAASQDVRASRDREDEDL